MIRAFRSAMRSSAMGSFCFHEVGERNLEGIVCKRKTSVYAEHGWLKIKNPHYTQTEGRHEMFEAFREHRHGQ